MPSTLIITNDFPPRIGGIESFVSEVCELLDHDVVVYTSGPAGAAASDRGRPFSVVRDGPMLLPTPRVAARARALLRHAGATRVIFGAAAPLGLLAPSLRGAGAHRILGLTHGHETWWARVPAARRLLRWIGDSCDHLTTISGFTERRIASALSSGARKTRYRALRRGRSSDSPEGCVHAATRLAGRDRSGPGEWHCARADHRWGRSVAGPA